MGWNMTAASVYNDTFLHGGLLSGLSGWDIVPLMSVQCSDTLEELLWVLLHNADVHVLYLHLDTVFQELLASNQAPHETAYVDGAGKHLVLQNVMQVLQMPYALRLDTAESSTTSFLDAAFLLTNLHLSLDPLHSKGGLRQHKYDHGRRELVNMSKSDIKNASWMPTTSTSIPVSTTPKPLHNANPTKSSTAQNPLSPVVSTVVSPAATDTNGLILPCLKRAAFVHTGIMMLWNTEKTMAWMESAMVFKDTARGRQLGRSVMEGVSLPLNMALFSMPWQCEEIHPSFSQSGLIQANSSLKESSSFRSETFYFTVI
jgi:hypothetical protein